MRRRYGWLLPVRGGVTARVDWHADAFLYRLEPTADRDLIQFAVGRVTSRRCNALFSPQHDEALVFEAGGLDLRPVGRTAYEVRCAGPLSIRRRTTAKHALR